MPGISAKRARAVLAEVHQLYDKTLLPGSMLEISARRARAVLAEVNPFLSKTLLPGSMPAISAKRARAVLADVEPFFYTRYKAKRYFRDLCPGFPREARARGIRRSTPVIRQKRYFRDLCPRFPRRARARYWPK